MGKLSQGELAGWLDLAKQQVTVGARYRHYKDKTYTVRDVAFLETTNEPCVIYQANYGSHVTWIRPLSDWLAEVEWQGKKVPRFIKI